MFIWLKIAIFSLILILSDFYFYHNVVQILANPDFIYSLELENLYPVIFLTLSIYLLSSAFSLVATLFPKTSFKIILSLLASLIPFIFFPKVELALGIGLAQGAILLLSVWDIRSHLRSYFHFNPRLIFSGSLHSLANLLAVLVAGIFFFSYSEHVSNQGFQIPQMLINQISDYTVDNVIRQLSGSTDSKQDLSALKQYGLSEEMIKKSQKDFDPDGLKKELSPILAKQLKSTLESLIKPYLAYIPLVTTILVYVTLASTVSVGFFLVPLFLNLVYFGLEKTKVVRFENQTQIVKRLVIEESNKKESGQ